MCHLNLCIKKWGSPSSFRIERPVISLNCSVFIENLSSSEGETVRRLKLHCASFLRIIFLRDYSNLKTFSLFNFEIFRLIHYLESDFRRLTVSPSELDRFSMKTEQFREITGRFLLNELGDPHFFANHAKKLCSERMRNAIEGISFFRALQLAIQILCPMASRSTDSWGLVMASSYSVELERLTRTTRNSTRCFFLTC